MCCQEAKKQWEEFDFSHNLNYHIVGAITKSLLMTRFISHLCNLNALSKGQSHYGTNQLENGIVPCEGLAIPDCCLCSTARRLSVSLISLLFDIGPVKSGGELNPTSYMPPLK